MIVFMNTITLKDVPPGLHKELKARARSHGRSLNKEILFLLQQSVHSRVIDVEQLLEQAREAREASGIYVTEKELNEMKNKGRS